ncbi:glycosyltransferase family 9 protein [Rhodospirillum sp. A1_3_36]|uniref:glycosyltransferase family 9 protein n=1 Tax=Rhodospirillum sp. A1_3_36 TaxID=3391666 RepID=UPI0039A6C6B5
MHESFLSHDVRLRGIAGSDGSRTAGNGPVIVLYRLGSLGDTIVALPCIHAARRTFPDARWVLLTNHPVSEVAPSPASVLGSSFIERVIEYPLGTQSLPTLWTLAKVLRSLGSDTMIYIPAKRGGWAAWRDWVFFKLIGFRRILCFPRSVDLQTHRQESGTGNVEREASRLVRCCRADFGPIDLEARESWDLRLTAKECAQGRAVLSSAVGRSVIAVNMGGKTPLQDWGEENWRVLFQILAPSRGEYGLVFLGAPEDRERAEKVAVGWRGSVLNACGTLSPRESAAVLAGVDLFVGHDSGPMHLAASLGVNTLGLFGTKDLPPGQWYPTGPRVTVLQATDGMQSLSVESVVDKVNALLDSDQ